MSTGEIWPITIGHPLPHAMGTSLFFKKSHWEKNQFELISVGEDTRFSNKASAQGVLSSFDGRSYVVRTTQRNTSKFRPTNPPTNTASVPPEFMALEADKIERGRKIVKLPEPVRTHAAGPYGDGLQSTGASDTRSGDARMDSNHIIQSFWMGKLTTMEKMCIRWFFANGHEFHLYSYGKLDGVPEGCIEKDANEIMPEARVRQMPCVQQSADFFRVTMLLKKGGWWADLDTICLRPFDFTTEYVFAGCGWDTTLVQNCVIKVPAGSPIMQEWHRRIDTLSAAQVSRLKFQGIGPELCAQLVSQFGAATLHTASTIV